MQQTMCTMETNKKATHFLASQKAHVINADISKPA